MDARVFSGALAAEGLSVLDCCDARGIGELFFFLKKKEIRESTGLSYSYGMEQIVRGQFAIYSSPYK